MKNKSYTYKLYSDDKKYISKLYFYLLESTLYLATVINLMTSERDNDIAQTWRAIFFSLPVVI